MGDLELINVFDFAPAPLKTIVRELPMLPQAPLQPDRKNASLLEALPRPDHVPRLTACGCTQPSLDDKARADKLGSLVGQLLRPGEAAAKGADSELCSGRRGKVLAGRG